MCLRSEFKDRRYSVAIAALCLAVGLMLPEIVHPAKGLGLDLVDFVRGLLIGVSLSINLMAVWKTARKRRSGLSA